MSFLSRLFLTTRSASTAARADRRRAAKRSSLCLGLERLEERWTPAIAVVDQGTDSVTINDSSSGGVNNAIEIIDDLDTLTTYIKINGGSEQQLGEAGNLLSTLAVNMSGGHDKVLFSVRGTANAYDGDLVRAVDLGAGNDSLGINLSPSLDLNGYEISFDIVGVTTGNDSYTATGGVNNGDFDFDLHSTVTETSGNDAYDFTLSATSGYVRVYTMDALGNDAYAGDYYSHDNAYNIYADIYDFGGNDRYRGRMAADDITENLNFYIYDEMGADKYQLAIADSTNAPYFRYTIDDAFGGGNNTLNFTQGNLSNSEQYIDINFDKAAVNNKVTIGGNAIFSNGTKSHIYYNGQDGADSVSIDDNVLSGGAFEEAFVYTAGGLDKVGLKLDGGPDSGLPAIATDADYDVYVELGDGKDAFTATVRATSWSVDSDDVDETGLELDAYGGEGNDVLRFVTSESPLALYGDDAYANVSLDGGAGDDKLIADLGYIGGVGDPVTFALVLSGGEGADAILVAGYLEIDDPNLTIQATVDLGADAVKDSLKSTFRISTRVALPSTATLTFEYANYTEGTDVLTLSASPLAPTWTEV